MGFDLFFTAALLPCKKGVISMDREWLRILVAALLAVILPHLAIHIGSKLQQTLPEPTPGTQTEAPTTGHAPTDGSSTTIPGVKIPVQIDDGAVMLMDLEEYVRGVVLAEMPASFEAEALKAQAVAARTYTLRVLSIGGRHEPGAICIDSSCCQAYISDEDYLDGKGSAAEWEKVTQAVGDTTGLVLTYNGKLIDATYFSCSGGRTEDAAAVWGSDVPYLQAVDSPGEEGASVYENEKYFSAAEFAQPLGKSGWNAGPVVWAGHKNRWKWCGDHGHRRHHLHRHAASKLAGPALNSIYCGGRRKRRHADHKRLWPPGGYEPVWGGGHGGAGKQLSADFGALLPGDGH